MGLGCRTGGRELRRRIWALVARKAEDLGFDSAFVGDHVVIPDSFISEYPYSATGEFTGLASGEWLDQLVTLTYVGALTERIRLGTGVLILPHRNVVVTAKMLATMDVLSKGRLIVGVGVGWLREEFEALGIPPFLERGAVGNEYLRAFKELWTQENPSFEGEYCSFSDIRFEPKPVQKPHPAYMGRGGERAGAASGGYAGRHLASDWVESTVSAGDGGADGAVGCAAAQVRREGGTRSFVGWGGVSAAAVSVGDG